MGGRISKVVAFLALTVVASAVLVGTLQQGRGPNPVTDPAAWRAWAGADPIMALVALVTAAAAAVGAVGALLQIFGPRPETATGAAASHALTQAMIRDLQAQIAAMATAQGRPVDAETEARTGAALTAVAQSDDPDLAAARQAIHDGDPDAVVDALIASASNEAAERLREAGAIAFAFNVEKAITAYSRAAALEPEDVWTHIMLSRLHQLLGDLPAARATAQAALGHADNERDIMCAHGELGDVAVAEGDLSGARTAYGESLEIARRLSERYPSNSQWLRDLSVSHSKLGDVARAEGDLSGARAAYREGLVIACRLSERDPSNSQWLRDLSISHEKLGDVAVAESDLSGARTAYGEGLAIRRRLSERDPSNTEWLRDLSISHEKLGDVAVSEGDLSGARAAYGESLAIARRLSERDPSNSQWLRDLSVSHGRLGDVAVAEGDLSGARAAYGEGLVIARYLSERDPSNTVWLRDLAISYAKLAQLAEAEGDRASARNGFLDAERQFRAVLAVSPGHAETRRMAEAAAADAARLAE